MIINDDCIKHLKTLKDNTFDSCVTDPPYHLASIVKRFGPGQKPINNHDTKIGRDGPFHKIARGFMGQTWDGGDIAFNTKLWKQVYRVLKPGAFLLSFAAPRNYHLMATAIENSGFEIRDQIMWLYGSGFPKSHNIGKQMDKKLGNTRQVIGKKVRGDVQKAKEKGSGYLSDPANRNNQSQFGYGTETLTKGDTEWEGWGTALKPAHEPIVMARKPIEGSNVKNVLKYGTGAINIDECRVDGDKPKKWTKPRGGIWKTDKNAKADLVDNEKGRFPANVIHDGSEEVLDEFEKYGDTKSTGGGGDKTFWYDKKVGTTTTKEYPKLVGYGDVGSPAKFFYCSKASKKEKAGTEHPTVKPVELMKYLIRLVTRKKGIVLDPFAGTGTTGEAAILEGCKYYLIEKNKKYFKDIENRVGKFNELFIES